MKIKRGKKDVKKKIIAFSQIFLLIAMSFAIAGFWSEKIEFASAATPAVNPIQSNIGFKEIYRGADGNGYQYFGKYADGSTLWEDVATKKSVIAPKGTLPSVAGGAQPGTYTGFNSAHPIKSIFGGQAGFGAPGTQVGATSGALVAGVAWAAVAYIAVKLIGSMLGLDEGAQKALENAALAGGFVAGTLNAAGNTGAFGGVFAQGGSASFFGSGLGPLAGGLIVGAVVFVLTYSETETEIVTFQCLPYEPPIGGTKCEECNKDPFRPCSEYRCKSLGQACQLLNPGTGEERCAWVAKDDVNSPTIDPWEQALKPSTLQLKYSPDNAIRPPNRGVKITSAKNADGCLPAFTALEFGVILNEPAQCKLGYERTNDTGKGGFDAKPFFFGDSNYFRYNHTQKMKLPSPNAAETSSGPVLKNDGTFSLYVKCQDANGNVNEDDFVFNFCVDKSPDTTPPAIESTSIASGSYVQFNADKVPIEVYVNEPAECKWSRVNKDFIDMENSMACATNVKDINNALLYTCSGELTGVKNQEENKFFFRCKDNPGKAEKDRNVNTQSYDFVLKGSQTLNILKVEPSNGTIYGSTDIVPITLGIETDDGAEEGKAVCYFSPSGVKDSYIAMFETDARFSKQQLDLTAGVYSYFFRCVDAGGNAAESNTSFVVFVDKQAPTITRAYKEGDLKIVTNENAECAYSLNDCNFVFEEGIKMLYLDPAQRKNHFAQWGLYNNYHIKCKDEFGNEPSPNQCNLIVSAIELERQTVQN